MKGLLKSKTGIHVVEIDDVSVPAKRQILIEVKAASFNRADYYAGSLMAKEHVVARTLRASCVPLARTFENSPLAIGCAR